MEPPPPLTAGHERGLRYGGSCQEFGLACSWRWLVAQSAGNPIDKKGSKVRCFVALNVDQLRL